jgi:EmrB/QacA subfamily drug resistance transporter
MSSPEVPGQPPIDFHAYSEATESDFASWTRNLSARHRERSRILLSDHHLDPSDNAASSPPSGPRGGHLGLILVLLVSAQFAVVVDFSIVQIALPTIRNQLGISLVDSQWIISAYGVTFAGFLLLSGRLSDIFGSKRIFLAGFLVFCVSSLAAGLATSELVLIGARIIQGVGAAVASASGLALLTRIFAPIGRLNQALGVFTAVSSAGFTAGILLGGVLTETLGWRWIFFVNVPIGAVATILAYRTLPNLPPHQGASRSVDFPGAVTVTTGLMLLVYGLTDVGNGSASYITYAAFILAGLTLVAFLVIERRSPAPILPLSFLRRRTVFFANATALLTFATMVPWVFFLTFYLQVLLSYPPLNAAVAQVPAALVFFFLGGFGAPKLVRRVGAKPVLVVAMLTFSTGMFLFSRLSLSSSYVFDIFPTIILASCGASLSATASNIAALSGAKRGEEGIASGMINTSRQIGGPVGLALAVSLVSVLTHGVGLVGTQAQVTSGVQYAFLAAASFAGLAVITSLLLSSKSVQEKQTIR